ncbi:hypothetical protein BKA69DRAFT_803201 [Paraphysoderma sedebokerense]|nr:hypothetical protein BKA69DRAFT_803201 [Paraphysoderma sedebokerense]
MSADSTAGRKRRPLFLSPSLADSPHSPSKKAPSASPTRPQSISTNSNSTSQKGVYSDYILHSPASSNLSQSHRSAVVGPLPFKTPSLPDISTTPALFLPKAKLKAHNAASTNNISKSLDDLGSNPKSNPEKAVEPKVILPYEAKPGLPLRRVEIERKKRLYRQHHIADVLLQANISIDQE